MKIYIIKKDRSKVYKSEDIAGDILSSSDHKEPGENLRLSHLDKGQPVLITEDGELSSVNISISDTKNYWVCGFGKGLLGIDAEELSRTVKSTVTKALHPLEQSYLVKLNQGGREWKDEFLHIWTAKEAYSKFCGEGLKIGFSRFSVLDEELNYVNIVHYKEMPPAHMHFERVGELALSIASEKRIDDDFEIISYTYDAPFKESAMEAAASLLDRQMLSEKELASKLRLKAYPEQDIKEAVEKLRERGYLDDLAYARAFARRAVSQGKGSFRIESELALKGIDKTAAREALELIAEDDDAPSEEQRALELAEKICSGKEIDDKLKAKAARRLSSLGYSSRVIYSVLEKLR